jgi:hypothetical protein
LRGDIVPALLAGKCISSSRGGAGALDEVAGAVAVSADAAAGALDRLHPAEVPAWIMKANNTDTANAAAKPRFRRCCMAR